MGALAVTLGQPTAPAPFHLEAIRCCGREPSAASTLPRRAGFGACSSPTLLRSTAACGSRIRKAHPRREPLGRFLPPSIARPYAEASWRHLNAVQILYPIGTAPSLTSEPNQETEVRPPVIESAIQRQKLGKSVATSCLANMLAQLLACQRHFTRATFVP